MNASVFSPESAQPGVNSDLEAAPKVDDATEDERIFAEKAEPVLDLQKNPTGWKGIPHPNREGMTLVSEDGKKSVTFRSRDTKSGTESQRALVKAQAYAIDNRYKSAEKPAGEPQLAIEDYTDKSIIIRGQTRENMGGIKDAGKKIGIRALWNKKAGGWVFPKSREAEVREALADLVGEQQPAKAEKARQDAEDQQKAKPSKGWREIGKNQRGQPLYEDERGVRSYADSGVRITESVQIIPGRGISITPDARGPEYLTDEERAKKVQAEQPKAGSPETPRNQALHDLYDRRIESMSKEELVAYAKDLRTELLVDERTRLTWVAVAYL
jgi:hypothetical protein